MGKFVWVAKMDIPPEHDALFNRIYDTEHLPAFRKVPGVLDCERYELIETKTQSDGQPRYAAVYHLESIEVMSSPEWNAAKDSAAWVQKVRPHTYNRVHGLYRKI